MGRGFFCVLLLVCSNIFMILAWYGHIALKNVSWFKALPLYAIVLLSWFVALFEYSLQVPANRIGSEQLGGPFSLLHLKVIQEVITLVVFVVFNMMFFDYHLKLNHVIGFAFLVAAVFFIFKG
ncbi:MAG: DMT family protein [Paludibacteraceae bacterium]|nr:DMT family protein [Paludibacteraceae bacterium]MBP5136856.1 DMT family protein [Paludibacteraceae bacterium]MBP5742544.1 DMT family protein [Paludibacteraceae bacterium]